MTLKIRQKTPMGAAFITRSMMETMASPRLSSTLIMGSLFSLGRRARAAPSMSAKKMTASMSPAAAALRGLRGTMFTSRLMSKLDWESPILSAIWAESPL